MRRSNSSFIKVNLVGLNVLPALRFTCFVRNDHLRIGPGKSLYLEVLLRCYGTFEYTSFPTMKTLTCAIA